MRRQYTFSHYVLWSSGTHLIDSATRAGTRITFPTTSVFYLSKQVLRHNTSFSIIETLTKQRYKKSYQNMNNVTMIDLVLSRK